MASPVQAQQWARWHMTEVLAAAKEDDQLGFCVECGCEVDGVEPDARRYECPECGNSSVYGAEELVMMVTP